MTATDPDTAISPPQRLFLLLLVAATMAAYANSFTVPAQFDDGHVFYQITEAQAWDRLASPRRWLAHATFALNRTLNGRHLPPYHAVNLAIHIANALLLYRLLRQLARLKRPAPDPTPVTPADQATHSAARTAAIGAALFALHPLAVQSVTYITQRYTALALCFMLLAITLYLDARRRRRCRRPWRLPYAASIAAAFAAMFCKELAVSLPFLLIALELALPEPAPPPESADSADPPPAAPLLVLAPAAAFLVIPAIYMIPAPTHDGAAALITVPDFAPESLSRWTYFITQSRVILYTYLRLLFVPVGLSVDHPYALTHLADLASPRAVAAWLSLATLTALFAAGLLLARRAPRWGLPILWFFFALAPTSSFVTNTELVAEQRMYTAIPALSMLYLALVEAWSRRRPLLLRGGLAIALLFAALTFRRNHTWGSSIRLWRDAVAKAPANPGPRIGLAAAFVQAGKLAEAEAQYRALVALAPTHPAAHSGIGNVHHWRGQLEAALPHYRKALELAPDEAVHHYNIALVHLKQGRYEEARRFAEQAIARRTLYPAAHHTLGQALSELGQRDRAMQAFHRAVEQDPAFGPAQVELGRDAAARADHAAAVHHFRRAAAALPADVRTHLLLTRSLQALGKWEQAAAACADGAHHCPPHRAMLHHNAATLYLRGGNVANALDQAARTVDAAPDSADAHLLLARARIAAADRDGAAQAYRQARRLGHPPDPELERRLHSPPASDPP